MKNIKIIISILLSLVVFSCGGGSSSSDSNSRPDSADTAPTDSLPVADVTEFFGVDGNLYKPVSDETASGGGNLVVLFSSKFTTQFQSCVMRLNTGEIAGLFCLNSVPWTQTPFSCFSNGNRQTWRANFRCSSAGEVRVLCNDGLQNIEFIAPNGALGNVCTRF